jgi:hypothetical protein
MKNILFSLLAITTVGLSGKMSGQNTSAVPTTSSFQNLK